MSFPSVFLCYILSSLGGRLYGGAILVQRVGDIGKHPHAGKQQQREGPEVCGEDAGDGYAADAEEYDEVAAHLHPAHKTHHVAEREAQHS